MITVNSRQEFLKELSVYSTPHYSNVAELGVLHGDFSRMILDIIKPNWLVLVDPYKQGDKKYENGLTTEYSTNADFDNLIKKFAKEILRNQISLYKMPSYNAVALFPNDYFDIIYHDASHLYDDLKSDLKDWQPKLKLDGFMCGHDYIEHEDFGVINAVDEFCETSDFEMFLLNKNGGDYALKRK